MKAFLGLMDDVKEYSLSFHAPTLGMSLVPGGGKPEVEGVAVLVGTIEKSDTASVVQTGDAISKINGIPVAGLNFNGENRPTHSPHPLSLSSLPIPPSPPLFSGVVARIKLLPRPMIVHFIQVIGAKPSDPLHSPFRGVAATAANNQREADTTGDRKPSAK